MTALTPKIMSEGRALLSWYRHCSEEHRNNNAATGKTGLELMWSEREAKTAWEAWLLNYQDALLDAGDEAVTA